jgi:hypothetical protein
MQTFIESKTIIELAWKTIWKPIFVSSSGQIAPQVCLIRTYVGAFRYGSLKVVEWGL